MRKALPIIILLMLYLCQTMDQLLLEELKLKKALEVLSQQDSQN
jgi:hypothetical protein